MAMTNFEHQGEAWTRITHEASECFVVGVDLGCMGDPTAICVLHHSRTPINKWKVTKRANADCYNVTEQEVAVLSAVVHLERVPLGTEYPVVAEHVAALLQRDPLDRVEPSPDLVCDATGVGLPVVQILEAKGLKPLKVTITSGGEQTRLANRHFHVAKSLLISHLDAAIHTGELRFAEKLLEAPAMKDELANFNRHVGSAGRATYAARTGQHDDLVLAVALAVWRARGGQGRATSGHLAGCY